jgi:hypothetical protein
VLIDDVADAVVKTASGTLTTRRYSLIELRQQPTPVEIWVAGGRLLRLEFPRAAITVVRSDVLP